MCAKSCLMSAFVYACRYAFATFSQHFFSHSDSVILKSFLHIYLSFFSVSPCSSVCLRGSFVQYKFHVCVTCFLSIFLTCKNLRASSVSCMSDDNDRILVETKSK